MDPARDLTLLVRPEDGQKGMIRVSSKALTLASPVFAALVSPKFAEGQALASNTITGATTSIPLPEDDPEVMKWFCRALHHKLTANEQEMSRGLCHKLGITYDKYDASIAMSGWSRLYMDEWRQTIEEGPEPRMLYAAYTFGDHQAFWSVIKKIFQFCGLDDMTILAEELRDFVLPNRLIGMPLWKCWTTRTSMSSPISS